MKELNGYKNLMRHIAYFLIFIMLVSMFSGCGKDTSETPPELIEPVSAAMSFRPVSYRNIADVEGLTGTIVPESDYVFSEQSVIIKSIEVKIGDVVEKGDIVAYGDTTCIDDEIEEKTAELSSLMSSLENETAIYDKEIEKLKLQKSAAEYVGDVDGAVAIQTQIDIAYENKRYNTECKNLDITNLNNEIKALEDKKTACVFKAPMSGTITFVKDIKYNPTADVNENIAVISDFEDTYIEVQGLTIDKYNYKDYKEKYIICGNEHIDITEYEYDSAEVSYSRALDVYPDMRFKLKNDMTKEKFSIGENVILCFEAFKSHKALSVGKDSLNKSEDGYFVYVDKSLNYDTATAPDADVADYELERREVTIGATDNYYVEIVSGLEEGEMVYYASNSPAPVKYETLTVEPSDYTIKHETDNIAAIDDETQIITSVYSGQVSEVYVSAKSDIAAGDKICRLETATGKARLTELGSLITNAKTSHTDAVTEFDNRENQIKADINEALIVPVPIASDTDATEDYMYKVDRLNLDLEILSIEREEENAQYTKTINALNKEYDTLSIGSDGNGGNDIVSTTQGTVGAVNVSNGNMISKGDFVMSVANSSDSIYRVMMNSMWSDNNESVSVDLGGRVTVTLGRNDKTCETYCIGENGKKDKSYLFTRDGRQYITFSVPYYSGTEEQFFVKLEEDLSAYDKEDIKVEFYSKRLCDVIVLPSKAVYHETDEFVNTTKDYVWKSENDTAVKEYVTTLEEKGGMTVIISGVNVGDVILVE